MITLEQIRLLESKVHKTVARMAALREENSSLRDKLENYERRITELEGMVTAFKEDQAEIEQGIITALEKLDELEDAAAATAEKPPAPVSSEVEEDVVTIEEDDSGDADDEVSEEEEKPTPSDGELDIF